MTLGSAAFQRGFDAVADEDFLGRWPLARKVAATLTSAPATCAVRIGVFGRWGTGKSSLLHFVKELAERDGHIVVEFSPWGYSDHAQMWQAFMAAIVKRLEDDGQDVKGAWKTSSLFTKTKEFGKKLIEARNDARAVAGALDPVVGKFFSFTSTDLREATSQVGEARRLIVLVDDVDRTDPRLVPDLLFALRQLLDLPGLSWVLAIDPELVGKALAVHHPGFTNAIDFLEKILEFMFWLPEPTPEQLWRLVDRDLRAFDSGIDLEIIRQESALLPTNPRSLRTFARQLWSLKPEIERHHPDEIDQRLLTFAVLMRTLQPRLYQTLISERDHELLKDLSLFWLQSRSDSAAERGAKTLDKIAPAVEATVEAAQRPAAEALLRRLAAHHFWTDEGFLYHAQLLDSPAIVTQAEFQSALDSAELTRWLDAHGERTHLPRPDIVAALFDEAVKAHNRFLQAAADRNTEEEQLVDVATVQRILQLLRRLGLEFGGFTGGDAPILTAAQFRALMSSISGWTHFVGTTYQQLREAEANLLCEIVEKATGDPFLFLNALRPWSIRWHDDDPDRVAARALHVRVASLAEKKAAPSLLNRLVEPGGVGAILGIEEQAAARYLLFRPASPLWQAPLREQVGRLLADANPAIGENSLDILRRLDSENGIRSEVRAAELDALARDKEIVAWLWTAGTKRAPNLRLFSGLKETRTHLEEKAGIALGEPVWWRRLDSELSQVRERTPRTTPADENGDDT